MKYAGTLAIAAKGLGSGPNPNGPRPVSPLDSDDRINSFQYLPSFIRGRAGTLAFPLEWALKYFTAIPPIDAAQLWRAMLDVGGIGLDDIADFPAGHALRATVFYGLAAFCVARLAPSRRQGMGAYAVALVLIGAISLTRLYLGAHYPIDLLGGWIAGAALVSVIVAVHVLGVDERLRTSGSHEGRPGDAARRVAVEIHPPGVHD